MTTWRKSSFSGEDSNCVEVAFGTWGKSSFSAEDANCVEVAHGIWHKSRSSGPDANCVEVAYSPEAAAVRDSKNPDGPRLVLTAEAYKALVAEYR